MTFSAEGKNEKERSILKAEEPQSPETEWHVSRSKNLVASYNIINTIEIKLLPKN